MPKDSFAVLLPVKLENGALRDVQEQAISKIARSMVVASAKGISCIAVFGTDGSESNNKVLRGTHELLDAKGIKAHFVNVGNVDGNFCDVWKTLSEKAIQEGADFLALLADDVEIENENWISRVIHEFEDIQKSLQLPSELYGFGCVALRSLETSSFPIFPVVHKIHCKLNEEIFPSYFPHQEADLFLFELYRRWGASRFAKDAISHRNSRFTDRTTRPAKLSQHDWKNEMLEESETRISKHLAEMGLHVKRFATVDVVTPTFRVDPAFIERICNIQAKLPVDVKFIIIVDDPRADVQWLRSLERSRHNVRVRVNAQNMGASFTRNVGLDESAAEWILFLDDDVIPHHNIIDEYISVAMQHHPQYCGFAGLADLPSQHRVFPTAVHLSQLSFFWRAPRHMPHVPWAVTANFFVRRTGVRFDSKYIKTGGGEDIDFCLKLPRLPLVSVPRASVIHPWWNNGKRGYLRFFRWASSDGILNDPYPHFTYLVAPDAIETSLFAALAAAAWAAYRTFSAAAASTSTAAGAAAWAVTMPAHLSAVVPALLAAMAAAAVVVAACMAADCAIDFPIFFDQSQEPHAKGALRLAATLESTLVKNSYALGRTWGHLRRGRPEQLCRRFDWFCGLQPGLVAREQRRSVRRFVVLLVVVGLALAALWSPRGWWRSALAGEWMLSSA